jgi:predicted RNA-binding Zn ribbon-like protein
MPLTEAARGSGVALAVDLINTWDEFPEPHDRLRDTAALRQLLLDHGFEAAAAAVGDDELERTQRLRGVLAEAFDAKSEAAAVALLNELAAVAAGPPQLERVGRSWRLRTWPGQDAGLGFVAGYCAVALLEAIRDSGWARFGRCAGGPCRCVYVDRSRNRSRRYCCQLCADRVAAASYRRRMRGSIQA